MAPTSPHARGFNGATVKQIRAEKAALRLTDAELAEKVGMHPTVLSRYLNYKRPLRLEDVERFAVALGMDYSVLVQRGWTERDGK